MSLGESINGYLDVRNATLRVARLDVQSIVTGVDTATNMVRTNSVILFDDQGSDLNSNGPFTFNAGASRSSNPPQVAMNGGYMFSGIKLPNQFALEFDLYCGDTNAGSVNVQMWTTTSTSYAQDAYEMSFDRANSTVTLRHGTSQVVQATSVPYSTSAWQKVVVFFDRGTWVVSFDKKVIITVDDIERSTVYANVGQYIRFDASSHSNTDDRKVRFIKISNAGPWLHSNTGTTSYLNGNVAIGETSTNYKLSVHGTANVGALTATSATFDDLDLTATTDATSTSTGTLTVGGGVGVASNLWTTNLHASNAYLSANVAIGHSDPLFDLDVHGTSNAGATSVTSLAVSDTTVASDSATGALVVSGGLAVGGNVFLEDTQKFTSNINIVGGGTATFVSNLRVADVGSNLVTYDQASGELTDSGGVISNKLAIISQQPPSALSANVSTVVGHGVYSVQASSTYSTFFPYQAFDKNESTGWTCAAASFGTDGLYDGTDSLGGVDGEWLKLTFPYKTILRHFVYKHDANNPFRAVQDGTMLGSNDGTTWTELASFTGFTPGADPSPKTVVVNATEGYKHYGFVVEKNNGDTSGYAFVNELRLFTETFSVDAGKVNMTAASGMESGFIEHPIEPMTGNVTNIEGFGEYVATASSAFDNGQLHPWKLFDSNVTTRWASATSYYSGSTGLPNSYDGSYNGLTTDVGGTRYYGQWVQIKTPTPLVMSHSNIHPITNQLTRAPVDGVILGSLDGENWHRLVSFSGLSHSAAPYWREIAVNATTPYDHFRMVVTKIGTSASAGYVDFASWVIHAAKDVNVVDSIHVTGTLSSKTGLVGTEFVKQPEVSLQSNVYGGYRVASSNIFGTDGFYSGWHAFEDKTEYTNDYGPAWATEQGTFDSSDGSIITSNAMTFQGITCHWLELFAEKPFAVSHFELYQREQLVGQPLVGNEEGPKDGYLYGSVDGVEWDRLASFTDLKYTIYQPTTIQVNSQKKYHYHRLVVTAVGGGAICCVNELKFYEPRLRASSLNVDKDLVVSKESRILSSETNKVLTEYKKHEQVIRRYPQFALTGNSDRGYVVSRSSVYSNDWEAYKAFNRQTGTNLDWVTADYYTNGVFGSGNSGTSTAGITDVTGVKYKGEWIQLKSPKAFRLEYMYLKTRGEGDFTLRLPKDATVLGSHDGSDWHVVARWSGREYISDYTNDVQNRIYIGSDTAYRYHVLVVEALKADSGSTSVDIGEMEYWGAEVGDDSCDITLTSHENKIIDSHLEVYLDFADQNSFSLNDTANVWDISGHGIRTDIVASPSYDPVSQSMVLNPGAQSDGHYLQGNLTNADPTDYIFSASLWVNMSNTAPDTCFFSLGQLSSMAGAAMYLLGSDILQFNFRSGNGVYAYNAKRIQENVWSHVVFTYAGGNNTQENMNIYVNGEKLVTWLLGGLTTGGLNLAANDYFRIGHQLYNYTGTGNMMQGKIGEFRLYSKELTQKEVTSLYEQKRSRYFRYTNSLSITHGNVGVGVSDVDATFAVAGRGKMRRYPPEPMKSAQTPMFDGVYTSTNARKSDNAEYYGSVWGSWATFDRAAVTGWHGLANYNLSFPYNATGVYGVTDIEGVGEVHGDWLQLDIPHAADIRVMEMWYRPTNPTRRPTALYLCGQKRGTSTWHVITHRTGILYDDAYKTVIQLEDDEPVEYYDSIRVVVTNLIGSDILNVTDILYYGYEAPTTVKDGTTRAVTTISQLGTVNHHDTYYGGHHLRANKWVELDTSLLGTNTSNIIDTSGYNRVTWTEGNPVYQNDERALRCSVYTSGSEQRLKVQNLDHGGGNWVHSISFWWLMEEFGTGSTTRIAIIHGDTATNGEMCWIGVQEDGANPYWSISTGGAAARNNYLSPKPEKGRWYHIVGVWAGGTYPGGMIMYVNGERLTATSTVTTIGTLNLPTFDTMFIGNVNSTEPAPGLYSRITVYNTALFDHEVKELYQMGRMTRRVTIPEDGLTIGRSKDNVANIGKLEVFGVGYLQQLMYETYHVSLYRTNDAYEAYTSAVIPFTVSAAWSAGNSSLWDDTNNFYRVPVNGLYNITMQCMSYAYSGYNYVLLQCFDHNNNDMGQIVGSMETNDGGYKQQYFHKVLPLRAGWAVRFSLSISEQTSGHYINLHAGWGNASFTLVSVLPP